MLKLLTWGKLLDLLLELEAQGNLPNDHDVMMHNIETGDEYPCVVVQVDKRLVMGINGD